ncbi:MAG TPA: antibiotic biosynthesis monooxygenase [Microbacterium sp.]|uniref:putative quinol monooxygenase n=1 Tax=Microbacterium sp. TaxID=51671 RepID=UPI002B4723A0|nr:antibiotic biosynthesis monooxygenase [Microbacterium sp.]HKT56197.1 antibiotic biosynthesis monooxygenase [Microbacterium sp.]
MTTITLTGRLICADDDEAATVLRHLDRHIELTRAESGCLQFDVEPTADPLVWTVCERFVDRSAFESHQLRVRGSDWGRATASIERDYVVASRADS